MKVTRLAFDPLAFKEDRDQAKTLRELVRLDVSMFDRQRVDAASQRALLKKTLAIRQAQFAAMPRHDDVLDLLETPLDGVSQKMMVAEQLRKAAEEVERVVERKQTNIQVVDRDIEGRFERVGRLRDQLHSEQTQLEALRNERAYEAKQFDALRISAEKARAEVPDVTAIRAELAMVEVKNAKVRANQKRGEAANEVKTLETQVAEHEDAVKAADAAKEAALRAVKFPVEGLGLSNAGVTFNGLPLAQASSAEQLRVSMAIGLALNPTLKVVLVKNGNLLDEDGLAALAKQAEEAGSQVWVEWVTKDAQAVQVFIEDGHVA